MTAERVCDIDTLIEGEAIRWPQISVALWLCTLMAIEGYDMQALSFVTPAILKQWHVSRAAFGPVLSAHLVGFFFGAFLLGFVSDRVGRKNIILAGTLLFSLFTIATGFATSPNALMVWRVGAGFGLGGAIPIGIALAVEYMPRHYRATAIGLMYVAYTLGSAIAGFIAARVIDDKTLGWPLVFFIGGSLSLVLLIGLAFALPELMRFLALKKGGDPRIFAIARRLRPKRDLSHVTRFTVHEEAEINSATSLFEHGRATVTILLWLAYVASLLGHYFLTSWMPTILADAGLTNANAANAVGLFQLGGAFGSFAVAVLLDRMGIKIVALTCLVTVPFVAALSFFSSFTPLLVLIVLIAGFGVLGGQIGLNAIAGTIYPTFMRSTGTGWALGIGRIGSISAPIIGGVLLGLGFSRPVLFLIASAPFFCCAVFLYFLSAAKTARDARESNASMPGSADPRLVESV